jgi:hypothetical protein
MKSTRTHSLIAAALACAPVFTTTVVEAADPSPSLDSARDKSLGAGPLPSWNDGKAGKPVGIHQHIGRRPIAAFGNSDGDLEMLHWTAAGAGPRLCLIVHHTDAEREWAYDRTSSIGRLDKALDEAQVKGWTVVSMKKDWKRVFSFEK